MKKILFLLLIPAISFSQKIKKNEVDKFTKQKRIETSKEYIREGMMDNVAVAFRSVDTTCFINLVGMRWAVDVIGTDAKLLFLLDNDETVVAISPSVQSYTANRSGGSYDQQYRISKQDIGKLASHNLKSLRRYTASGYTDLDIKDRMKDRLKELSTVFLQELNK